MLRHESAIGEKVGPECISSGLEDRSAAYGFLAGIYNNRPDEEFACRLQLLPEAMSKITFLSESVNEDVMEGLRLMQGFALDNAHRPPAEVAETLAVDRTRLFRGVMPGYGPPPPYETVYLEGAKGTVLACYAKAGMQLPPTVREEPDYLGIELEFLRELAERESQARTKGDLALAAQLAEMQRGFLEAHLCRWVPQFCENALAEARTDFYRGAVRLTRGFLDVDLRWLEGLVL